MTFVDFDIYNRMIVLRDLDLRFGAQTFIIFVSLKR